MPKKKTKVKKVKTKKIKIKTSKTVSSKEQEIIIKTKPQWVKSSLTSKDQYKKKYSDSIKNNDEFWKKEGKRITWIKPYTKIKDVKYSNKDVKIKWFHDGTLNASANCIDRHRSEERRVGKECV